MAAALATAAGASACTTSSPEAARGHVAPLPVVVFLIRHGEKTTQPGNDPPLSNAGRACAAALADALRDAHVTRIIATQWRRTQETAAPLAEVAHVQERIVSVDPEHIRSYVSAIADSVRHGGGVTLVVGHQNTVSAVITALDGPAIPEICGDDYGDLYVLVLAGPSSPPSLTHATFGAPHPAHGPTCAAPPSMTH